MDFTQSELGVLLEVIQAVDKQTFTIAQRSNLYAIEDKIRTALNPLEEDRKIIEESIDEA